MNLVQRTALTLIIIGAINWGLIGFFQFDLVAMIFGGQGSMLARIIYALVGLSGLYALTILFLDTDDSVQDMDMDVKRMDEPQFGTEFSDEFEIRPGEHDDPNRRL